MSVPLWSEGGSPRWVEGTELGRGEDLDMEIRYVHARGRRDKREWIVDLLKPKEGNKVS